ncbi:MAG: hypothetical protein O6761_03555 [Thaumarchaeota archaeon]|nr:MAG: hypothetical protein NPMRIOTA_220015 [Nitrosopumilales archaeon]MCZ6582231.1 hypothetical protein [Nitrososphaerota archaeon]
MIDKNGLEQIMQFVSKRWVDLSRDAENKAFQNLPTEFWMNSVGGAAGKGRWMTMLVYTEDATEANSLKEVMLRWQSKHEKPSLNPSDLITINKK